MGILEEYEIKATRKDVCVDGQIVGCCSNEWEGEDRANSEVGARMGRMGWMDGKEKDDEASAGAEWRRSIERTDWFVGPD